MRKIHPDEKWYIIVPEEKMASVPLRGEFDILTDEEWDIFIKHVPEYFGAHGLSDKLLDKWKSGSKKTPDTFAKKVTWRFRKLGWLAMNSRFTGSK